MQTGLSFPASSWPGSHLAFTPQGLGSHISSAICNFYHFGSAKQFLIVRITFSVWSAIFVGITDGVYGTTAYRCDSPKVAVGVEAASTFARIFARRQRAERFRRWAVVVGSAFGSA